jgi:polyisoprenoid-binding protein YceI
MPPSSPMVRTIAESRDLWNPIASASPWIGKGENASVEVTIQTASIFTDHEKRDADLRSGDFFAADSFPVITFRSTKIERSGSAARIHGDLTMRGITRPVVLEGQFLGLSQFPNNSERVAFEASTTINRLDYGVKWNRMVEGAGLTLGDDVKIEVTIQATRRRPT